MKNKKIYNIIPGRQIDDNSIIDSIFFLLESVSFDKWIELNEDIYNEDFFLKCMKHFMLCILTLAGVIKRLYISKREEILTFMKERINYRHSEGVDIAICTIRIDNAVICNHDGQVFLLLEEKI